MAVTPEAEREFDEQASEVLDCIGAILVVMILLGLAVWLTCWLASL
jgi:hypothetical protein